MYVKWWQLLSLTPSQNAQTNALFLIKTHQNFIAFFLAKLVSNLVLLSRF